MQVPTSLIHRLREGKAGTLERLRADQASLAVYTTEEVLDVAARGNVVLRGWGATCLLRAVPHVVCVRVHAAVRAARRLAAEQPRHRRRRLRRRRDPAQRPRPCGAHARAVRRHLGRSAALRPRPQHRARLGRELRRSRSPRWRSGPSSPRPTRRARCCRTWRSRRAFAPRCAPTRRHADVDVTVDEQRRPRRPERHGARRRRAARGRARRPRGAGRGRRRQPAARDGAIAALPVGLAAAGVAAQILPRCLSRLSVSADRFR